MEILEQDSVLGYLEDLERHLSPLQRERLSRIVELLGTDHRGTIADILDTLFPKKPRDNASTDLRKLRLAFNDAAEEAGASIRCKVSSDRRGGAEHRRLWFEGASRLAEIAERFSASETGELDTLGSTIAQRGVVYDSAIQFDETRDGKPLVRWFLSYAHRNRTAKDRLLDLLLERLACSKHYFFEIWSDLDIVVGDDWHESIQGALENCHFGLLLLSHAFFSRKYIREHELSQFVRSDGDIGGEKRAVPIALESIEFNRIDMRGLEKKQVYLDQEGKAFKERAGTRQEAWVNELVTRIESMLDRYRDPDAQPTGERKRSGQLEYGGREKSIPRAQEMILRDLEDTDDHLLETAMGQVQSLDKDRLEIADAPGVDALDFLMDWLRDVEAPPLFALLGEYGMGKTITCQRLVRALDVERDSDPSLPTPIYFDLRNLTGLDRGVPLLVDVVNECIRRGWQPTAGRRELEYQQIEELARAGALVIFDGLDEALVHMSSADGQAFTRELMKFFALKNARDSSFGPRILISCRTHYFRTLRDQINAFTGHERGAVRARDYRALVLLPFSDDQVHEYLKRVLPSIEVEQLQELIRSVHNLSELTQRPYTLKLVAKFIPDIEKWRAEGRNVFGVTLYRRMVRAWLERDSGKHILKPDHKMLLMAHLAAHLMQRRSRLLLVSDLESWFNKFLASQPELKERYSSVHPDKLEEDLRTATFLVRQDSKVEGDMGAFRFAHSSMLEFFLADHLFRALRNDDVAAWALPLPSQETLDFLGQMLGDADDAMLLVRMSNWRSPYRQGVGEILLSYTLLAMEKGWPTPELSGIDLRGVDLSEWVFKGWHDRRLNLSGANFGGANLRETKWHRVRLQHAEFLESKLEGSEWVEVDVEDADFGLADLSGSRWRIASLKNARFDNSDAYRMIWMDCVGLPNQPPSGVVVSPSWAPPHTGLLLQAELFAGAYLECTFSPHGNRIATASDDGSVHLWDAHSGEPLHSLRGHNNWVRSCAFSPKGDLIASAGHDGKVCVWDARSGNALGSLLGHEGGVRACAFSPNGDRIASAGEDGTIRLWDAHFGKPLRVLRGRKRSVWSCAFSPDGDRIASAVNNGTVRLWDAHSGMPLRTLRGHENKVTDCAFSPNCNLIASVGNDGTVRLWDANTGSLLRSLFGHEGGVRACAFSPDGDRIASAGDDGIVRLWDAHTGKCVRTLQGHNSWVESCAFSPDGNRIASAGQDGTVCLWDAHSGGRLRTLRRAVGGVESCAISPKGYQFASAGFDGTVRIWDSRSGKLLQSFRRHVGRVNSSAFSPTGDRIASAGDDYTVRLWDAFSGVLIRTLTGHVNRVRSCAFSPDGDRIASASDDGTVRLWDVRSGKSLQIFRGHNGLVWSCAFSPDGDRIASAGPDRTVRLWEARSGKALRTLRGHTGGVGSCAFAPQGGYIASASDDGTVRLWDVRSGSLRKTLRGHISWVEECAFSPDGNRIASASRDRTVRIWDTRSGALLQTLHGHNGGVGSCVFFPNSDYVLSASDDGTIRLWYVHTAECLRVTAYGAIGHAIWDPCNMELLEIGGDFWRWLFWSGIDPETGELTRYPADYFGYLPPARDDLYEEHA